MGFVHPTNTLVGMLELRTPRLEEQLEHQQPQYHNCVATRALLLAKDSESNANSNGANL